MPKGTGRWPVPFVGRGSAEPYAVARTASVSGQLQPLVEPQPSQM